MFNKTLFVTFLALALAARAAPHHRYGHAQNDNCSAGGAITVTAIQTVTVTAGTSAATTSAVNNGGNGGAVGATTAATTSKTTQAAATTSSAAGGNTGKGGDKTSTTAAAATITAKGGNGNGGKTSTSATSTTSTTSIRGALGQQSSTTAAAITTAGSKGGNGNDGKTASTSVPASSLIDVPDATSAVTTSATATATATSATSTGLATTSLSASVPLPTGNQAADNSSAVQDSLTLDSSVIATGFASNGQETPTPGQVASLTTRNNFINFCATVLDRFPIMNGQQIKTGACNPAPMGVIASTANMPSSKFVEPLNFATLKANTPFTVSMAVKHLDVGHFTNAASTYFAAPQQVNADGDIIGHTHFVIEKLDEGIAQTTPGEPTKFAFFKGINDKAVNGVVSTVVSAGLPAGDYKLASINSAANHQPVLVVVAQHASLDDMVYFSVTEDGLPAGGAANPSAPASASVPVSTGSATALPSGVSSSAAVSASGTAISSGAASATSALSSAVGATSIATSASASETAAATSTVKGGKGGKGDATTSATSSVAAATTTQAAAISTSAATTSAAATTTSAASAGSPNFGSCQAPAIKFAAGLDGRKGTSFAPDASSFNHGSALDFALIGNFICQQLKDACKADAQALALCNEAVGKAAGVQGGAKADAFNAVFGKTSAFKGVPVVAN